jgi:predicted metal-dependent phosphoesterase TrpH
VYLDLHSHSVSSDDSRATVEQYLKWIQVLRKRGHIVDGIVLTEHRKFDFDKDYSALAGQYNVLVLKASELDTRYGHFLVYGVNELLAQEIDFSDVRMDARELMRAATHHGALAIPAHPGRFGIGLVDYMDQGEAFEGIRIVELLNGGSRQGENERASELCAKYGYLGIGGSDAHLTSHIGACLTRFQVRISSDHDLVEALHSGHFEPVWLDDSRNGAVEPEGAAETQTRGNLTV